MDEKLQQLRDRLLALHQDAAAIPALADDEKRDNTPDELAQVEALGVEMDTIRRAIDAREKLARQKDDLGRGTGRRTDPAPVNDQLGRSNDGDRVPARSGTAALRVPAEPLTGRLGFRNFGDFALSVRSASTNGGVMDRRLDQLSTSTYSTSGSGSDGGFLIPPDFRQAIMTKVMGEESLVGRTDQLTTSSNALTVPVDDAAPWGTTGVRVWWEGEGAVKREFKPDLKTETFRLNKLAALCKVTDELLEDAPALDAYLRRKVPQAIDFKLNEAVLFGNGVGMPQGAVNSAGKVRVAKEAGQAADTILYANVAKMWSRMYGPCRRNAVWVINQDVEPQLWQMSLATGSNSGQLVFMPPGGVSGSPYSTLFGRPVVPVENASALGDEGDVVLWDPSTYLTLTKNGNAGLKTDVSIHLHFDQDVTTYRFVMRFGGQNWWRSPVTRAKGVNTLGNVVTLEDRA